MRPKASPAFAPPVIPLFSEAVVMAAWVALLCETAPAATVDVGAVVIGAEVVESSGEKTAEVELESAAVLEVAAAAEGAAAVVAADWELWGESVVDGEESLRVAATAPPSTVAASEFEEGVTVTRTAEPVKVWGAVLVTTETRVSTLPRGKISW
jgi:hypothetical protein